MPSGRRVQVLAGLVLISAAILVVFGLMEREESGAAAPLAVGKHPTAGAPAAVASSKPAVVAVLPAPVDIFSIRTWQPPAPQQDIAPAPPQPPQAPPLPFRFIGRVAEPGKATVFLLAEGERVLDARIGDRIGSQYRVEKLEAGQLVFRYRPMNLRQSLAIGEAP